MMADPQQQPSQIARDAVAFASNGFLSMRIPDNFSRALRNDLHDLEYDVRVISSIVVGYDLQKMYQSKRIGRQFDPQTFLRLPSIYKAVFTPRFANALITYFGGREPCLFYASFIYVEPNMSVQDLHSDIDSDRFPTVTVLIDLELAPATTHAIAGSHLTDNNDTPENPYTERPTSSITETDNIVMFDGRLLHHGVQVSEPCTKLALAFIPKYRDTDEMQLFRRYCEDHGLDRSTSKTVEFPLLALKYFM
jgi:hypothetical protein